jgi:hypothetical protein
MVASDGSRAGRFRPSAVAEIASAVTCFMSEGGQFYNRPTFVHLRWAEYRFPDAVALGQQASGIVAQRWYQRVTSSNDDAGSSEASSKYLP